MNTSAFEKIRPHIVPIISLFALTLLVYSGSMGNRFLLNWDDIQYVVENADVKGISWEHLQNAFTRFYVGNYAPLHIVSYMLDYTLWGMRSFGFVLTNVVIHVLNGVLFYLLLIRMGGRKLPIFIATFIFLLHPVQVESVAWISQRKTLLSMFFFLFSFYSYVLCQEEGKWRRLYYFASVVTFVFSLLSKSVTVIMPAILFLYDICLTEKRGFKCLVIDKVPFLLAAAAITFVSIKSQQLETSAGLTPHLGGSPLSTLFTMLPVLARYIGLFFLPTNLSVLYMPPIKAAIDTAVFFSGILVVALVIIGIVLYRFHPRLFFWFGFFFIGLLPVSQIVPLVTFFNDRYLYFPLLGASALAGYALSFLLDRPRHYQKALTAAVLGIVLLLLPLLSWKRTAVWQNDLTLWSDAAAKEPDCADAWFALGMSYDDAGSRGQALLSFLRVLTLDPNNGLALNNVEGLPGLLESRGLLLRLMDEGRDSYEVRMLLGTDFYLTGEYKKADEVFLTAARLKPRSAWPLRWLGNVFLKTGEIDRAGEYYRQAARLEGTDANLELQSALVEAIRNKPDDALRHLDLAFRLGYKNFENLQNTPELDPLRGLPEFQSLLYRYFPGKS